MGIGLQPGAEPIPAQDCSLKEVEWSHRATNPNHEPQANQQGSFLHFTSMESSNRKKTPAESRSLSEKNAQNEILTWIQVR